MSFAYASYKDCQRYNIKPIPWLWGEYWVREKIDHNVNIIGQLINTPEGTFVKLFKKIDQIHFFHNIIFQPDPFPWHVEIKNFNINLFEHERIKIDQFISFDGFEYLSDSERMNLLDNINSLVKNSGSIVIAFKHFFNLSSEAFEFFNSEFVVKRNHRYFSHVNVKKILDNKLTLSSLGEDFHIGYGFSKYDEQQILNDKDVLSPKYFEVINKDEFLEIQNVIKIIENTKVTFIGISLKNEN